MNASIFQRAFKFFKNSIWNATHKDAAKMLIGMGALGFALSSLGQCFAISINDKIDKGKKRFLLMQEAADGVVNIGLFLGITSSVWKISDKLLKLSGIATIGKGVKPAIINPEGKGEIKSGGRILTTVIASVLACNIITPLIRNVIAGKLNAYKERKEEKSKMVVNEVIKNQTLSPFKSFDNFAMSGISNISFKSNNPYSVYNRSSSLKI